MQLSRTESEPVSGFSALIARQDYTQAVIALRTALRDHRADAGALRQRLADILILTGDTRGAGQELAHAADEYARTGAPAKAIAVLKKLKQVDPSRVEEAEESLSIATRAREDEVKRLLWSNATERKRREAETGVDSVDLEPDTDLGRKDGSPKGPPRIVAQHPEAIDFELDEGAVHNREAREEVRPDVGSSPLFSDFATEELLAVMRGFELRTFEPGDIVFLEGAPGNSLFVLTTGVVKVFVRDPEGNAKLIRAMEEGAFFGEVAILTGMPRTATIAAASDCEMLELDRKTLDAIVEKHPRVWTVLEEFCGQRLNSAAEKKVRDGQA